VRLSTLVFLIGEAGRNIRRNGMMSLAALSTVAITLAVFGGASFTLYRLNQYLDALPRQFEIAVFVDVKRTPAETRDLRQRVAALPGVSNVTVFSRDQAWAEMQQDDAKRRTDLTANVGANPLPDRLDVRVTDPRATLRIAEQLRKKARFPEIDSVRDDRETVERLLAAARLVRNVGGIIALLLFVASAIVIQNTIRLTVVARRREIRIMQLVGATAAFIRLPLVLEGILYGAVGALLAGGMVLYVAWQIAQYTSHIETPLSQAVPPPLSPSVMLGILVLAGAVVGLVGSVLSIRRFLKRV
jgi:cell division transport system permease protein